MATIKLSTPSSVLPSLAASGEWVGNARDATAAFNDPTAAIADGYDLLEM